MIFGEYSDIVENDNLSIQRFLDVSRFLYSGVGSYASYQSYEDSNWLELKLKEIAHERMQPKLACF